MNFNGSLVICGGSEYLALLYGDRRVSLDDLRHNSAVSLNAERKRGDVEKNETLNVAAENTRLNSRSDSDALIGVDSLMGFLIGKLFKRFLNGGDS